MPEQVERDLQTVENIDPQHIWDHIWELLTLMNRVVRGPSCVYHFAVLLSLRIDLEPSSGSRLLTDTRLRVWSTLPLMPQQTVPIPQFQCSPAPYGTSNIL